MIFVRQFLIFQTILTDRYGGKLLGTCVLYRTIYFLSYALFLLFDLIKKLYSKAIDAEIARFINKKMPTNETLCSI